MSSTLKSPAYTQFSNFIFRFWCASCIPSRTSRNASEKAATHRQLPRCIAKLQLSRDGPTPSPLMVIGYRWDERKYSSPSREELSRFKSLLLRNNWYKDSLFKEKKIACQSAAVSYELFWGTACRAHVRKQPKSLLQSVLRTSAWARRTVRADLKWPASVWERVRTSYTKWRLLLSSSFACSCTWCSFLNLGPSIALHIRQQALITTNMKSSP